MALLSKRLNDRDRPDWLKWLFWAPFVIGTILGLLGLTWTLRPYGEKFLLPLPNTIGWLFMIPNTIFLIWAFIECGFLRGTVGTNQYGPDPLA